MPFELADHARHLIVQPSDLALDPPESYLFVQDGLIIACGALYALCYIFCMIRTYSDKTYPGADFGAIQFLSLTMAYELFYAFTTTTTRFEKAAFLAWFELDLSFVVLAIRNAHAPGRRMPLVRNIFLFVLSGIALLYVLCQWYPDDREQFTAYWTGILLQFPIGYACLFTLWKDQDTAGHSLEIWLTRYIGCFAAYGVFLWRYWNVPQHWEYVAWPSSVWIMVLTLVPETIYPFVYFGVHKKKAKVE